MFFWGGFGEAVLRYYKRQHTFIEPMVSLEFLKSKPDFSAPVVRPSFYAQGGTYPSSYSVTCDSVRNVYEVTLKME